MKILAPVKVRISIAEIYNEPWCIADDTNDESPVQIQIFNVHH